MEARATPKLSRQDWLQIASDVLIGSGIEAVRVEPLAKLLKVTRGSFYWHFNDRDELLETILQEWEALNTSDIIDRVEAMAGSPQQKLLNLFEIAAQMDDRLEKAIRIWGVNDERAAVAIARIDQRRLDYLQTLFRQAGYARKDAKMRAQIAYTVRLGWFMMIPPAKTSERIAEIRFLHQVLIQNSNS
jgi:AcrR family transcriptional regulator